MELKKPVHELAWQVKELLKDIHHFLRLIPEVKVTKIHREANLAADWLAKQAKVGLSWNARVHVPPPSLVSILSRDGLPAPPNM